MSLHLIKLCVGVDTVADLVDWIAENAVHHRRLGRSYEQIHTTRMTPRRADEILPGGSLYWVVKGHVACRQRLLDIRPFTDDAGIGRCRLVLDQDVLKVVPRPCRPFQGWRYLAQKDVPADLGSGDIGEMPDAMRRELAGLGLL